MAPFLPRANPWRTHRRSSRLEYVFILDNKIMKPWVLISSPSRKDRFVRLAQHAEICWLDELNPEELERLLPSVECIFTFTWPRVLDPEMLSRMSQLRFIQCELAGVNQIPFRHIGAQVIVSSNAGGYSHEVAEYAWGLLLAAAKKIPTYNSALRAADFTRPHASEIGNQVVVLRGKTLGVIGYGGIGRAVGKMGAAFGMNVCAFSRRVIEAGDDGDLVVQSFAGSTGLLDLLKISDACVLAIPLTKLTRGFIGAKELGAMRRDGILVNIARGEIVDEAALYEHLVHNPDFVCATDVWWTEEGRESFSPRFPLLMLGNFIGTPHVSGPSAFVTGSPSEHAIDNLLRFLRGDVPENVVDRSEYL
jgi:D-3-phosphoglycerate dehydrogenase / 2-oxoglutarate reductase